MFSIGTLFLSRFYRVGRSSLHARHVNILIFCGACILQSLFQAVEGLEAEEISP